MSSGRRISSSASVRKLSPSTDAQRSTWRASGGRASISTPSTASNVSGNAAAPPAGAVCATCRSSSCRKSGLPAARATIARTSWGRTWTSGADQTQLGRLVVGQALSVMTVSSASPSGCSASGCSASGWSASGWSASGWSADVGRRLLGRRPAQGEDQPRPPVGTTRRCRDAGEQVGRRVVQPVRVVDDHDERSGDAPGQEAHERVGLAVGAEAGLQLVHFGRRRDLQVGDLGDQRRHRQEVGVDLPQALQELAGHRGGIVPAHAEQVAHGVPERPQGKGHAVRLAPDGDRADPTGAVGRPTRTGGAPRPRAGSCPHRPRPRRRPRRLRPATTSSRWWRSASCSASRPTKGSTPSSDGARRPTSAPTATAWRGAALPFTWRGGSGRGREGRVRSLEHGGAGVDRAGAAPPPSGGRRGSRCRPSP